jgi:hypothetical protein
MKLTIGARRGAEAGAAWRPDLVEADHMAIPHDIGRQDRR